MDTRIDDATAVDVEIILSTAACTTSWSSKLSTPRSHRHRFYIAIARFSMQADPLIIATQPSSSSNRRATRELGEICVPACMWQRLPTRIPPVCMLLASTRKHIHHRSAHHGPVWCCSRAHCVPAGTLRLR